MMSSQHWSILLINTVEDCIWPKKIVVFPLTRMTLFFCTDPAIFMAFQKK